MITPIPETLSPRVAGVRDFSKVKSREPIVTQPGSPERFEFTYPESYVLSSNKRPPAVSFEKSSERNYPLKLGLPIGSYNRNEEKTIPRLNKLVPSFNKMKGRTTQVLEHIAKNPQSPPLTRLQRAFECQAKSSQKIPKMATLSSRDDLMYRTNEGYKLNVNERQDASSPPKFVSNNEKMRIYAMAKLGASCYLSYS